MGPATNKIAPYDRHLRPHEHHPNGAQNILFATYLCRACHGEHGQTRHERGCGISMQSSIGRAMFHVRRLARSIWHRVEIHLKARDRVARQGYYLE
jgi:hypothetical protein